MGKKAEADPCAFWQRLTEAWSAKGLPTSQNGVADRLGMRGNGSTRRWYLGQGLPETETLIRIADLGKVTVDWLLTGNEPKYPVTPKSALERLLKLWEGLEPENHEYALRALEGELARQQMQTPVPAKRTAVRAVG